MKRKQIAKALSAVAFTAMVDAPIVLRANGDVVGTARRDELLAKCMAGEYVELELEVKAFEQEAGKANRNFIRLRDGMLMSLGRSGKGNPFLRDHRQGDSLARAGTIIDSKTEKLAEGHYVIRQTVKLTAAWAVELALRGLISTVSIGWHPTGPVLCSACNAEVLEKCWHWPGDRLRETEPGGNTIVEWVFTEAELVETSIVPVPAVPSAHIEDIRASLAATLGPRSVLERGDDFRGDDLSEEIIAMDPKLLALLGLALTATPEEVLAAAARLRNEAATDRSELAIVRSELAVFQADIDKLEAEKKKKTEDDFIASALASGRIAKGDESAWRELFQLSPDRAQKRMSERTPGLSTPVGQPPQREQDPAATPAPILVAPSPVITGGGNRMNAIRRQLANQLSRADGFLQQNPRALAYAVHMFGYEADGRFAIPATLGASSIVNVAEHDASKIGFHAAFMQSLVNTSDDPLNELFTVVPSNRKVEEWDWMGDLPVFEEWKTDRKLATLEAFKLRVENKKWSNGIRIKADDVKDDALGLIGPSIAGLAQVAHNHRWDMLVQLLLNGFAGSAFPELGNGLGYDGAFFFSDSGHRGGNDNKMTAALDSAGLVAAQLLLRSMKTYDGLHPLRTKGTHLIVGPKLEWTAEKLLTQEYLASGESNPHRNKYKLIVSDRIEGTYDDYWFLADLSKPIKPFLFQMREEISTSGIVGGQGSNNDSLPRFQYDELWYGAEARYNVGYFEHRLIVGSAVA